MTTYATPTDVSARLGRELTTDEITLVSVRLEDVERKIRRRIPDLDDRVTNGDIAEDDLVQVEAEALLRLIRNPDGYLSETDGSYSYMFSQSLASGQLTITPEEWQTLGVIRSRMSVLVPSVGLGQ